MPARSGLSPTRRAPHPLLAASSIRRGRTRSAMRTHRSGGCPSTQSRQANTAASPPPPPRTPHPPHPPRLPTCAEALLMLRWQSILISTISMLASPNLDSPANLDAAVRARPAWHRALAPDPSCADPACAPLRAPPRYLGYVAPCRRRCGRRRTSSRRRCSRPLPPPPPPLLP
jgi:hypothetical protein